MGPKVITENKVRSYINLEIEGVIEKEHIVRFTKTARIGWYILIYGRQRNTALRTII